MSETAEMPEKITVNVQFSAEQCFVLDALVKVDSSSRSAIIRKAVAALAKSTPALNNAHYPSQPRSTAA